MNAVRIKRYSQRRRYSGRLLGCGCTTLLTLVMIMLCVWLYGLGVLTPMVLRLTGVDRLGKTDEIFAQSSPVPTVILHNRSSASEPITIWLGALGNDTLIAGTDASASTGNADDGGRMAQVSFTEPELLNICHRRSEICRTGNSLYRNVTIDLRPGGAVVYLDAGVGFYWQPVGVVVQLDGTRTRFYVTGVDVNGIVYDPTSLPFGLDDAVIDVISQIERQGNELLRDLAVRVDGDQFRLFEAAIDDTTLTLTLR